MKFNSVKKIATKLIFTSILIGVFNTQSSAEVLVHVIDVGYGSAVHVEDGYRHFLFDVGPEEASATLVKHLTNRFATRISAVFLTHAHKDHVGGLLKLIQLVNIEGVYWNEDFPPDENIVSMLDHAAEKTKFQVIKPGIKIEIKNSILIEVLKNTQDSNNLNDNSLVYAITFNGQRLLVPGDIGKERQANLAQTNSKFIKKTTWMLWPHHGDELDSQFLKSFKNLDTCVVSVGENPYNLPHEKFSDQSKRICKKIIRTDIDGTVSFQIGKNILPLKLSAGNENGQF